MTAKAQWQECLRLIQTRLNQQQYDTWFARIKFKSFDPEAKRLVVFIPSQEFSQYLEKNHRVLIYQALFHVFGLGTKLTYQVAVTSKDKVLEESQPVDEVGFESQMEREEAGEESRTKALPKSDLDPQLNYEQTFANFLEGMSNQLARSVGQSVAEHPTSKTFNPLFIFGPSGCGKTHLVNAIGVRLTQMHPEKRVLYISAHLFQLQYVDAVKANKSQDFIHFYQGIDCLILDDVQELSGKQKTLEAFFHIFNHLHLNGRQIVMTSDRSPAELKDMDERMLTRFKWGMTAEIESPDGKLRHDILEYLVKKDGLEIPQDVIDYVSQNVQDNVRELEGVVHRILAYSIMGNAQIDLPFVVKLLKPTRKSRCVVVNDVVEACCRHYQLNQEQIIGSSRRQDYVIPRHVAMYLAHKHTGETVKHIGMVMGGRSHATVLHALKLVEEKINTDAAFRREVREVEKSI